MKTDPRQIMIFRGKLTPMRLEKKLSLVSEDAYEEDSEEECPTTRDVELELNGIGGRPTEMPLPDDKCFEF